MDIPFPVIKPHLTFADWFNADNPCDEDAELTKLEQAHHRWRCVKHAPVEKPDPEPIDEGETEDDGGNEDADESEDSHDVDEEERIPATDSPEHINEIEQEQANLDDDFIPDVEVVEASLWPYTIQDP